MKYEQAQNALARLNIHLPTLTDVALEQMVFGRGITSRTLVTMHRSAKTLARNRHIPHRGKLLTLREEAHGALLLKAHAGDQEARSYLHELSKV